MGMETAGNLDQAFALITGTFSANGSSAQAKVAGRVNVNVTYTAGTGTVTLERSFDGGATWSSFLRDKGGNIAAWTAAAPGNLVVDVGDERNTLIRLTLTAAAAATIVFRISQ